MGMRYDNRKQNTLPVEISRLILVSVLYNITLDTYEAETVQYISLCIAVFTETTCKSYGL